MEITQEHQAFLSALVEQAAKHVAGNAKDIEQLHLPILQIRICPPKPSSTQRCIPIKGTIYCLCVKEG